MEIQIVISKGGHGKLPLFRIRWVSNEEQSPLSADSLNLFSKRYALSPREEQVLSLTFSGMQMKEMAKHLTLAIDTIKEYLHSLYRKVGVDGRGPLVARLLSETTTTVWDR